MFKKASDFLTKHRVIILFLIIAILGLYLRFWKIENVIRFDYDQGRDAWATRDILKGDFPLRGPKTGIGDFYLGPAYFYILAPFYFATGMDPVAAHSLTIVLTVITFVVLFLVVRKVFNTRVAFIALAIYALSAHGINIRVPWNITFIPLLSTLIFYCTYQIIKGKLAYLAAAAALIGFFFHIHFTAIFLPAIVAPTLLFVKKKRKLIKWILLSIPAFLVWFIPTIIDNLIRYFDNYYRGLNFFKTFLIGPHLQFMLYRLPDSLLQFSAITSFQALNFARYVIPITFILSVFLFEKDKDKKPLAILMLLWFAVPLFGFTMFAGHVTDYYYLLNLPIAIFIIAYLIDKLISIKFLPLTLLITALGTFYFYKNTQNFWHKPNYGGLQKQKATLQQKIKDGQKFSYVEGDIESYLYTIWEKDKKSR